MAGDYFVWQNSVHRAAVAGLRPAARRRVFQVSPPPDGIAASATWSRQSSFHFSTCLSSSSSPAAPCSFDHQVRGWAACVLLGPGGVTIFNSIALIHPVLYHQVRGLGWNSSHMDGDRFDPAACTGALGPAAQAAAASMILTVFGSN